MGFTVAMQRNWKLAATAGLVAGGIGLGVNELIFPIIITTFLGLIVAIVAARLYAKLPGARASDPQRPGAPVTNLAGAD